jgi:hypothetical protein
MTLQRPEQHRFTPRNSQCEHINRTMHNLLQIRPWPEETLAEISSPVVFCIQCNIPCDYLVLTFFLMLGVHSCLPTDMLLGSDKDMEALNIDNSYWVDITKKR